jgi:hypothetical protein
MEKNARKKETHKEGKGGEAVAWKKHQQGGI